MEEETGICGRDKEVKEIYRYICSRVQSRKAGILYLTGPPGTGKTMSMQYVLDLIKQVPKLNLNCLCAQSSKVILTKICNFVGLSQFTKFSESEMISRLNKKFTGRTSEVHIIVLDELDKLPKSKNVNLVRTIFSWTQQVNSKLILVGIANTVNLTSRCQAITTFLGADYDHVKKIIFKPYSSKDIGDILQWYLDNDENFEDASIDHKALDMISKKIARDNGDIRSALNALKSVLDDAEKKSNLCKQSEQETYPTPPSTPPLTPCKEKTNLASVANSIKKRQVNTHYMDDKFPFSHQIVLTCLIKLSEGITSGAVDSRLCRNIVLRVLESFSLHLSEHDYRAMLEHLELLGWIAHKKGRSANKIVLRASENELANLIQRKEMIMKSLNSII